MPASLPLPVDVHANVATFMGRMEGITAAREGKPITANPYDLGSDRRDAWMDGWHEETKRRAS